MNEHHKWKVLDRFTPSGKQLFECQLCGRVSPTPEKTCAAPCPTNDPDADAEALRTLEELTRKFRRLAQ